MRQNSGPKRQTYFSEYLPQATVQFGLKIGHFFSGTFRVNAKDCKEGYVTVDGLPCDVLFYMQRYQNRAIDGDEVVFEVPPVSEWRYKLGSSLKLPEPASDAKFPPAASVEELASHAGASNFWAYVAQRAGRTPGDMPWSNAHSRQEVIHHLFNLLRQKPEYRVMGRVVSIQRPSPRRERVVGVFHPTPGGKHLLLLPLDPRLPRQCLVSATQTEPIPAELQQEAEKCNEVTRRTLVQCSIVGWEVSSERPDARYSATVGPAGDKEAELAALRVMHGLEDLGFSDAAMACLPPLPWGITAKDEAERRDFRSARIVSIDPPTARDLDDAVSVSPLPNGNYRVGVHIADVGHFVAAGSALDREALERATSIYLVDRVIPMLPRMLCEELCSLNPGVDRLSFSVEWELTPEGAIKDTWFGRSIICTAAKLSYLHAQDMIDGTFDPDATQVQLHGGFSWEEVTQDVCTLHRIATALRQQRFANGALRMDNPKLTFALDQGGQPVSCSLYQLRESNQLIEEFMLLANRSVATFIADVLPERAILRRHPAPPGQKLLEVQRSFHHMGYTLDASTSAALHNSLEQLRATAEKQLAVALQVLATKPMLLALYFCTGALPEEEEWRHYALNMPRYTHFTSPIRRYPDILVHRALAAALEIKAQPSQQPPSPAAVAEVCGRHGVEGPLQGESMANHCNKRRVVAREAQDRSSRLFLALLLRDAPLVTHAVVTQPGGDRFLPAFLPELGCECRIPLDAAAEGRVAGQWDGRSKTLTVRQWGPEDDVASAMLGLDRQRAQQAEDDDFDSEAWASSLQGLRNPQQLPPCTLPMQPECLQLLPVVVGAHMSRKIRGHPNDIMVRLYVDGMPDGRPPITEAVEGQPPGVVLAVRRTSVMDEAYELE